MSLAAVVLAAGGSRRLGRPKQLEPWGGMTLLGRVVANAKTYPVSEVWVVLGDHLEEILAGVDLTGCGIVENPEWENGLSSSIRVGLDALTRLSRAEGALLLMGDQPDVDPQVVAGICQAYKPAKTLAVVPKYRYTWANPVLVDRSLWPRLMSLEGDEGAKKLLLAHSEWVHEVWFEALPPRDVDTWVDVEELRPR